MAKSENSSEEAFNVYWKIKNFPFCCDKIRSPEFSCSQYQYYIELSLKPVFGLGEGVQLLRKLVCWKAVDWTHEISLLTCDGSPDLPLSGHCKFKEVIFGKRRSAFLPGDTLTLRLRDPSRKGKIFISSQIGVTRNYFLWTFNSFSQSRFYSSKTVKISELYGNIELNLYSMCVNNSAEKYSIEITRSGGERCYCVLGISVMDVNGKAVEELRDEFIFEKPEPRQTRGFPLIIDKNKLLAYKNLLLPNDTLTLKCYFAISLGKVVDGTSVMSYYESSPVLTKEEESFKRNFLEQSDRSCVADLQNHFRSMLVDGILHDVNLLIGSEVVSANTDVLSSRSPVFRAMFKDTQKIINNSVDIKDLNVETVRRLLLYMYTDTVAAGHWETMKELYSAAQMYEVLSLKEKCVSFLKTNLSISNVSDAFVFANSHQDGGLKAAVLDFISENDSEVYDSPEWKQVMKDNPCLALQILQNLYCDPKRIKIN